MTDNNDFKKIVLLVEDDEAMTKALENYFKNDGIVLQVAKNGEEGLQLAKEMGPDLILLDLLMPKLDGIAMLKKLREEDWGKNVKVMILTNLSSQEKERDTMELGAVEYVIKSDTTLEDIAEKIASCLGV